MRLEDLLIFVAVLVAVFINIVRPALKRRREAEMGLPPGMAPVPTEALPSDAPPASIVIDLPPTRSTRPARRREPLPFEAALSQPPMSRARPARALLGNRAELRRAVVARTLLGPCRAVQPFGSERD